MASVADDGDLIDLGSGICVSRAADASPSPEEQEHLLDVCPPKLEHKLALTQSPDPVPQDISSAHVLVTLGHDQLVPISRRIDVVSSDTIKRIKNITKNLEPVIQKTPASNPDHDFLDSRIDESIPKERETFEKPEINDAFKNLAPVIQKPPSFKNLDCLDSRIDESIPKERETFEAPDINDAFKNLEPVIQKPPGFKNLDFLDSRIDESIPKERETFKAPDINDAFKNLEPVTQKPPGFKNLDELDSGADESIPKERETFETREINDAFNFLAELEDNEEPRDSYSEQEEVGQLNESIASDGPLMDEDVFQPLEPTCCIDSREMDADDRTLIAAYSRARGELENPGFEASTPRKSSRRGRRVSVEFDLARVETDLARSVLMRTSSFSLPREMRVEMTSEGEGRREMRPERKSWSEGVRKDLEGDVGLERTSSEDVDYCEPSTSDGTRSQQQTTLSIGLADSSSECSEVDWSWLEDLESSRTLDQLTEDLPSITPPLPTAATTERMLDSTARARGWKRSAAMPVAATPKSLPTGSRGPPEPPLAQNNNNANTWVRASMRRLRHLRLPEADGRATLTPLSTAVDLSERTGPNSLPEIALIAPEILAAQTNGSFGSMRVSSAPETRGVGTPRRGRRAGESRTSSVSGASDTTCSSSSGTSTAANSAGSSPTATPQHVNASRRVCERQRGADRDDERGEDDDEDESPLGRWPHALSPALACLGCTLGLFNISRFAILSIHFGANFIVQFLVLSLVLGIPLLTLQVCLGQRLSAGTVDMWKISPLFQGVGIALLSAQALTGIYSIVGVSWMFVYFRDSFITKQDRYRWAEPFLSYREDTKPMHNTTSYKLQETVPDYFSGAVLQRYHLNDPDPGVVTLKFQVAFNLAVVWMIVFVSLSKGLRSYGKVVYVFTLVPVFGTLVLCAKLLGLTPTGSIHQIFPETEWREFFTNGKSWVAASSEVFLTWGLLGAAAMQIAAHNKHKHLLQRDTSLVVVLTFVVLLLAAFLANTCVQILKHHGYKYTTSSFEKISGYTFMRHKSDTQPQNFPERLMPHASFLVGQRVIRPAGNLSVESGYQVLRLATELVPATLAMLGTEQVSPFWAVLFYFILILFGIAQQLAIWHCVITGIMAIDAKMMKLWETTITFFSCACAYILGLPMATELGIYVVYYLDYTVGGGWWIMVLYLFQVGAVFAVRGRPHTGEAVVAELFPPTGRCLRHWAGPLLSFTWNVILPVALMVLSITIFKSSGFRDLYTYRRTNSDYWSTWAKQLGAAIQLTPILLIPGVAIIQTCRYLNSGPPDIFDRIQLLYRPSLDPDDPQDPQTQPTTELTTSIHGSGVPPSTTDIPFEDPPPKYTPPPSYTTATGARIAKMLRQSFRRSVRRIANVLGESSAPRPRPALQPPPPDYATVLVEMNAGLPAPNVRPEMRRSAPNVGPEMRRSASGRLRPSTIDRSTRSGTIDRSAVERSHATMDRARRHVNVGSSNLTAADVANLLRSSIRRGSARTQQTLRRSFVLDEPTGAVSVENLVEGAAPIGEDSVVIDKDESLVDEKTVGNSGSVI